MGRSKTSKLIQDGNSPRSRKIIFLMHRRREIALRRNMVQNQQKSFMTARDSVGSKDE